ncbi:YceG family protein [Bacillus sp. 31A1R]|uniref:YceG family protein n=1 Tax=Robertmurraya mangrovi TaxID=3098077 RepID=A0ABU5J159_9BACI|nr:YceG family protein [Bacillus sp. 31A1R]MDZ5473142.1 YceG family protein [Bacillus sp. 31A1R]
MYPSYNLIHSQILPLTYDNWFKQLKQPINERPNFLIEQSTIHYSQVIARFLGIPLDEDEYYNHLFDYVQSDETGLHLLSDESMDKSIDNQQFQKIQKVLNINREQNLSINRFVAFLDGEQLLMKSDNPSIHRKIREAMIDLLKLFAEKEKDGLKNNDIRRVLVDVVKWSFNHIEKELAIANPEKNMPKFLWYGNFKKSHSYLSYYIARLGCDLIVFNPSGEDVLSIMDEKGELTYVHQYPERKNPEPFPKEKLTRKSTVAYKASREIETILNHEGSHFYKPWQLRDYTPSSLTLKTTYDELFLIMKEIAVIRPNFEVSNGVVKIPSVFAKIQGVSRNRKEYWERFQSVNKLENSLLIKEFPFTRDVNNDFRFHYRNALGKDGILNPEKMLNTNYWKYQHLPTGLQKGIGTAIRNICAKPALKPVHGESMEEVKIYLFTQGMQIPPNVLKLLQQFDYSQAVPKLLLYNNELNGVMTRSDAALLLLLNQFGIDIILYNPPGHNDIENYIESTLYDTHWLEEVVFEQEIKEPSIVQKVLFQGILKNLRRD